MAARTTAAERAVMASIDQLKAWFERDLRFATWDENVLVEHTGTGATEIRLYTDTNEYALILVDDGAGALLADAMVRSRKPRAGLQDARMRRLLAEGRHQLNERVWRRILGCIVGLELVRVHRRDPARVTDEGNESEKHGRARRGIAHAATAGC
jgi:hypothetical protein